MLHDQTIAVVIPARNEEKALPNVLQDIPSWVDTIVVADNGSTDGTVGAALDNGAEIVSEPREGYGYACQAGIEAANSADVIVFLDGDRSDHPGQMERLVVPIVLGRADFVVGSRVLGRDQPGALTPQQKLGNALACFLIKHVWGHRYTDLGPFRAIRRSDLTRMGLREMTYGWTVEMQIRAIQLNLRIAEAPVDYRRRIGTSKVSGTVRGVIGAGVKILSCIARSAVSDKWRSSKTLSSGYGNRKET